MFPSFYFFPAGSSRMATLSILPALVRRDYHVIGMAEVPKSDGLIITIEEPVEREDLRVLGLKPLDEV